MTTTPLLPRHVESALLECIKEVAANLLADFGRSLLDCLTPDFLASAYGPVRGAEDTIFRLRFRADLLEVQWRAALRAEGIDLNVTHATSALSNVETLSPLA